MSDAITKYVDEYDNVYKPTRKEEIVLLKFNIASEKMIVAPHLKNIRTYEKQLKKLKKSRRA